MLCISYLFILNARVFPISILNQARGQRGLIINRRNICASKSRKGGMRKSAVTSCVIYYIINTYFGGNTPYQSITQKVFYPIRKMNY